ncbi:hypothetical protein GJW-30_1_01446 [Variibacter gotjawalensis]|uniref:Aerotolerance regulator N-terminal domain-containing protein n=1 Tax=Variibacter gotjawalensis TaxID=1333996 RepID=A0A0S3PSI0_9BRAD|nr:DUF4159 domain-containing protein [Variibacter gotjawalensis]NIK49231.1 hypothetical protein [Variibacter gotjawalensis]RZS51084.1 putative membrane protein (TIGR02226 family) [Variibacter gotjawalensis]BAT58918.1 hypothetical protein GJW-30_1_01446 [Variibacter gotjawalensis]
MLGLPLAFTAPWILIGLASLPVLWWLLRLVPPRPRVVHFPPTRILFDIAPKEETPSRTPWWLTLLRLLLAALLILAAAGPLWNPPVGVEASKRPILMLLDDGWSSAAAWDQRLRSADDIASRAEADGRAVALMPLSEVLQDLSLQVAGAARVRASQLKPKPQTVERAEALPTIQRFLNGTPDVDIVWLSDGVDIGNAQDFVRGLKGVAKDNNISVIAGGLPPAHALAAAENTAGSLTVKVLRAEPSRGEPNAGVVRALDLKGLPLGEGRYAFKSGEKETDAVIDLPVEIRNDVARMEIAGERSAGVVQLLDKRWRRRTIGVVSGASVDTAQPLLASTFYLSRALAPFADVRLAEAVAPAEGVRRFLDQNLPLLILADVGNVGDARDRLARWVEQGGVLVRFAGPRLAAADDDLVPVKLRRGGRTLGGSLTWEQPQQLASFGRDTAFTGMPVPNDVTVTRQVLAEPDATLADRTWASLGDGTPLVTAVKRGRGMIVLFHVTADTRWSDLPLSGSFVDMLKRIVNIAGSAAAETTTANGETREVVPPSRVLDGFGAFTVPPPSVRPVPARYSGRGTAEYPPGFYGPPEGLVAVNTLTPTDRIAPVDFSPLGGRVEPYRVGEPQDLRGLLFMGALALMLLDALVVFWLAGGAARFVRGRRTATAAILLAVLAGALAVSTPYANAQDEPQIKSALETKLAYVITGDAEVDAISKSGLQGLTLFLAQRTALEAGEPIGLDITKDELAFYPLIYWPIVAGAQKPTPETLSRIDTYMKQGGTVLFDTRDAIEATPGNESNTPGMVTLRSILSGLDVPALEPVPREHVLTKTFFLLKDFWGRFSAGQLWVEALPNDVDEEEREKRPARAGDGVSSVLITSNDLAGAWATRPDGQPTLPLTPGEPRQREMAFRAGVNIVIYTLTGNYKADQVHVPALLERLGQ